jgi:hypothetical protein
MAAGVSSCSKTEAYVSSNQPTEELPPSSSESPEISLENSGQKKRKSEDQPFSPKKQKAYEAFKNYTGLSSPNAKAPFAKIAQDVDDLNKAPGRALLRPQESDIPKHLVLQGKVAFFDEKGNNGANASAIRVTTIPFNNESPKKELVKQARKPFTPQKKAIRKILNHPACDVIGLSGEIINVPKNVSRFAFCTRSDGDLTKISYSDKNFEQTYKQPPVQFILSQLIPIADCLTAFHKEGLLHRDLKGANLLYNIEGSGKVTDFDMVQEVPSDGVLHFVGMTPEYAPGFIWKEVTDQRLPHDDPKVVEICQREKKSVQQGTQCSVGRQTKEADVAAFAGHTLEQNIIVPMIKGLSERYGIQNPLDLSPQKVQGPFSQKEMQESGEKHQGRVIYQRPNLKEHIPECLFLYPLREEANIKIQAAITKLEGYHPKKELNALCSLAALSYLCKKEDPKELPSMEEITIRLQDIQTQDLQLKDDSHEIPPPQ